VFQNGLFLLPLVKKMGEVFSDIRYEDPVELLEVKLTTVQRYPRTGAFNF
jgi:hypothetical protein